MVFIIDPDARRRLTDTIFTYVIFHKCACKEVARSKTDEELCS